MVRLFPLSLMQWRGDKGFWHLNLILIAVEEHRRRKDLFCLEGRIEEILQKKLHHKGMKDVQASDK